MFNPNLAGYITDPDVNSPARGDQRGKQDWMFSTRLLPLCGVGRADQPASLREFTSPRHNQVDTGTCVAQGLVKAMELKRIQAGLPHIDLSVLALYFQARQLMNPPKTNVDKGTYIWLAADCLRRFGVAPESIWPFDTSKKYLNPGWKVMKAAYPNKIRAAYRIDGTGEERIQNIISALHAGNPVVYATKVGDNWRSYRKGQVLSDVQDGSSNYHCTVLLDWTRSLFLGENSWGNSWGDDGFYLIDPAVVGGDDSNDFWTITRGHETYLERTT